MGRKIKVLFVCTENACRSQMAEHITNALWGHGILASSGGTRPKKVNPLVAPALEALGIEVEQGKLKSKSLHGFLIEVFDLVVTLCEDAANECPLFPDAKEVVHLPFSDPAKAQGGDAKKLAVFVATARKIQFELGKLFGKKGWI